MLGYTDESYVREARRGSLTMGELGLGLGLGCHMDGRGFPSPPLRLACYTGPRETS